MAGGKLISTGVEFPDATTQTTSGLPLTGGALTGAVTTTSTFDGRDVAADGVTADAALPKAGGTMTGTIAGFTSTGIDDNATSTAITIDASKNVRIGGGTPESNGTLMDNFEFGVGGLLAGYDTTYPNTYLGSNVKFNAGGGPYYKVTDQACLYTQNSAGIHTFNVAPSGTADTAITWTTAMSINNDGSNLMTAPTGTTPVSTIYNTNNVIGDWDLYLKLGANGYNTTSYFIKAWNGVAGISFLVLGNGNVQNLNNSYAGISDEKLKENIIDASSQWEDVKALQIKNYSLKIDNLDAPNQLGVIAQDLEASGMNGLVDDLADTEEVLDMDWVASEGETEDDRPTKHVDLGTTTKSVKYSVLYMKAVKALQEAMIKIEALEARVTALEV